MRIREAVCLAFACSVGWAAKPAALDRARIVVTAAHYFGNQPAMLTRDDLTVTQGSEDLPIINMTALRGEGVGLEVFLLVDNGSNCEPGPKFDELRDFIRSQPSSTAIGVAYIRDGKLAVIENPNLDRERSIRALSTPDGGKPSNPFNALQELIVGWPADASRHVVIMISNGMDPEETPGSENPSAESAIAAAQRAGVMVYTIYHPSADYEKRDYSRIYSGQVQLSHVATETGGEGYFLDSEPLSSFAQFLADISRQWGNQYLVEFLAQPGNDDLLDIIVKCKPTDVDLRAPYKVVVSGTRSEETHNLNRKAKSPFRKPTAVSKASATGESLN